MTIHALWIARSRSTAIGLRVPSRVAVACARVLARYRAGQARGAKPARRSARRSAASRSLAPWIARWPLGRPGLGVLLPAVAVCRRATAVPRSKLSSAERPAATVTKRGRATKTLALRIALWATGSLSAHVTRLAARAAAARCMPFATSRAQQRTVARPVRRLPAACPAR